MGWSNEEIFLWFYIFIGHSPCIVLPDGMQSREFCPGNGAVANLVWCGCYPRSTNKMFMMWFLCKVLGAACCQENHMWAEQRNWWGDVTLQPCSQPGQPAHLETNIRTDRTPHFTDNTFHLQAHSLEETLRAGLVSGEGNVSVRLCKVAGLPIWGNITSRYHTVTLTLVNISPRSLLTPLLSCQENDNLTNWQFYILLNFLKLARHQEAQGSL